LITIRQNTAWGLRGARRILLLRIIHAPRAVATEPRPAKTSLAEARTGDSGLDKFDPATGTLTHYQNDVDGLFVGGITHVIEDSHRDIWFVGRRGLFHLNPQTGQTTRPPASRNGLAAASVYEDESGDLWMLTHSPIAHELNQPLSGVVSNGSACLRWLAVDAPNVEEARENARRIVRDGKRAGEVIARIRALTKRGATARERLDLNETIQDVLALVADEAKKESVIIRTQFADDLPPVSADRVQLQQVILKLVMNAIEAMSSVLDRARELVITTRNIDPDLVQVTFEDSGIGIDAHKIDKIFDSFYTTKPGGMGMGLSICRSILQTHGGRLWATARDGAGTMFHFTLPNYHEEGSHAGVAGV
jgi:hypothetical protein